MSSPPPPPNNLRGRHAEPVPAELFKRLKPEVQAKVASNTPHGTARVSGATRRADGAVFVHFRVDDLHRPDFYLEFEIPLSEINAAAASAD